MKVSTSDEVRAFLRTLAPQSRQTILRELDKVEAGHMQPVALEPPLERFYKIRAGRFRVLCAIDRNQLFALFAERRAVVYEVASATLLDEILRRETRPR
jgi:mRNA-degrading endonuclease RelE of RelBE toxin-antitoxin system